MPVYKVEKENKTKDSRIYYFSVSYKDIHGNKKRYKSKKFKTKDEAKKAEAVFILSINKKKIETITLNELFEDYLKIKKNEIKEQSIIGLKKHYKFIKKEIGDIEVIKIDNKVYEDFKAKINNTPIAYSYKCKIHQLAKALYKHGMKYYGIEKNTPDIVGGFKSNNTNLKRCDFFTLEEYKQFRDKLDNLVWIAYFDVLYYCGLRKNEANALNWTDIDFNKRTINVNKNIVTKLKGIPYKIDSTKTLSSNRILPIPEVVLDSLLKLYEDSKDIMLFNKSWFVFGGSRPLSETRICNVKNKTCELAGLKQIRVHDFRHSCASLLINNGANITLVAKYLGHTDIEMTLNTYSHMFGSKLNELITTIDNLK